MRTLIENAVDEQPCTQPGASPRVVAIGGGTGLPNVLRGLRPATFPTSVSGAMRDRIVAIVATADDGGSSGRLRATFNMIPPGDIRKCLAALSGDGSQMTELFQYRFGSAGDGLAGHTIGNLMLAALADVTRDFADAVEVAARMLGARGVVLPATSEVVTLRAAFSDGRVVSGESSIARAGGTIARVSLMPECPACPPRVTEALKRADVIVAGPGSLYTSVLPPLLVPAVADGLLSSRATRILVANLMTEAGETDNFTVLDHLRTVERHLGRQPFDWVIYNTSPVPSALAASYAEGGATPIVTGPLELKAIDRHGVRAIGVPLVCEHPAGKIRHNPDRLASAITAIAFRKLGAWRKRAEAGGV